MLSDKSLFLICSQVANNEYQCVIRVIFINTVYNMYTDDAEIVRVKNGLITNKNNKFPTKNVACFVPRLTIQLCWHKLQCSIQHTVIVCRTAAAVSW